MSVTSLSSSLYQNDEVTKSSLWAATRTLVRVREFPSNEGMKERYSPKSSYFTAIGSSSVTSNLSKAHETRESLEQFLFAGNRSLSPSISSQFTLLQPKIAKKSLKINIFRVQGRSRSSMLINPKSLSPVLVMISSMYVPICHHFYPTRENCGKITTF